MLLSFGSKPFSRRGEGHMGDSMGGMVVVVSQEGQFKAVSLGVLTVLLTQGYRLATPAELNQYVQEQRKKSDLRE